MDKRKKEIIYAMIPARMGSTRLQKKNLALLGGKPLIYYAVKAARDSGVFDRVIINSEDVVFAKLAKRYGVDFYHRPKRWATSDAKSDHVVYDFLRHNICDIVAWVNPTSPLQPAEEIRDVAEHFIRDGLDSLITVVDEQVHCIYKGSPINFNTNETFARTQDLLPVQRFVYSVMMWRADVFISEFDKKGYAFFCGKTGYYPVNKNSGIIIKRKEDLMVAEHMLRAIASGKADSIRYDQLAAYPGRAR